MYYVHNAFVYINYMYFILCVYMCAHVKCHNEGGWRYRGG